MESATQSLAARWNELLAEQPELRIRNAAQILGVSEADLLATRLGDDVRLLEGDWKAFLKEVQRLGRVMALTRNDYVVHERKGVYNNVSFEGHVGLVLDPDIDLRLFMSQWHAAFYVQEPGRGNAMRRSFQFFDTTGTAVHKIYLLEEEQAEEAEKLCTEYLAQSQTAPSFEPAKIVERPEPKVLDQETKHSFGEAWKALQDTHDFYGLIRKFGLDRISALEMAPEGFAEKLPATVSEPLLKKVAEAQVPIMVFVGNPGCIQIHTGPVKKVMPHGPWYNVMDPAFNLHINQEAATEAWLVRKPTADGIVTSVEVFAADGTLMVQFFGKRKPGIPEAKHWTVLANGLPSLS